MKQSSKRSTPSDCERRPLVVLGPSQTTFGSGVDDRRGFSPDPDTSEDALSIQSIDERFAPIEIVEEPDSNSTLQLGDLVSMGFVKKQSGFLVSFALHLFLLFVLSVVFIQVGTGEPLWVLEAKVEETRETESLEVDIDIADSEDPFDVKGNLNDLELGDFEAMITNVAAQQTRVRESTRSAPDSTNGTGESSKFFGAPIEGRSFVFVIDRSGSMQYGAERFRVKSKQQVSRFRIASAELMRSVRQMTHHQEFYVLLFSNETKRMFDDSSAIPIPVKATEANKLKLERWLATVNVNGGTDPRDSLDLALKMRPDAIFMLSDGEFGANVRGSADGSLEIVKNSNPGNVPIHTIALEDAVSKANMLEIAEASGGEFRFVTILEHLQESSLGSVDPEIHLRALRQLKTLGQINWRRRYKFAKRVIKVLELANPESHALASETLHWLSFELQAGQLGTVTQEDNPDAIQLEVQNWRQFWQESDRLVFELRNPDREPLTSEPVNPEALALATFGDFTTRRSLAVVSTLISESNDIERASRLTKSMKQFQNQFSGLDPFISIYSDDLTQRNLAMSQIVKVPMDWEKRFEFAKTHLLPLLESKDEKDRQFAEHGLNKLSFELFQIPAEYNRLEVLSDPSGDVSREWNMLWQEIDDIPTSGLNPVPNEGLSFECRLFHSYVNFPDRGNIEMARKLAESNADITSKIRLAKSLISFQEQFGMTEECPEILTIVCNELADLPKREQRVAASVKNVEEYEKFLNKILRQREKLAGRKYRTWEKLSAQSLMRPKIKKLLIEEYPETKYAEWVGQ